MTVLMIITAIAAFPVFARMVRADAIAKAEARLSAETEAFLRSTR